MLRHAVLALTLLPALAFGAPADWSSEQSAQCVTAIAQAEARHRTLPGLLMAIAKAESGRPLPPLAGLQPWPWAVNADGNGYFFDSKDAAVAWTTQALQRGVAQIDVGCLQINLQSHPNAFASIAQAFDPAANADYAARFLTRLLADAGGNWYEAIGHYHSYTPELAQDYRERVSAIAQGKVPPQSALVPLYVRAIRQGTLHLGALQIHTHRQPARIHRALSACQVASVLGDFLPARARAHCH